MIPAKRCLRSVLTLSLMGFLALNHAAPLAAQTPAQVIEQVGWDQKINEHLPLDLPFHDENGREVKLGDYFGKKPVILALVYYECPMLCTFVLNGVVQSLRAVKFDAGKDFEVVAVSIAPKETPELAAAKQRMYVKEYNRLGTESGWHFLTGSQESITRLTNATGFRYTYDPGTGQYAHASGILILTPQGKIYRHFFGIEYAPRDVRFALMEASHNALGTRVDRMLLFCFHYDPSTGKYTVLVMNVVRILGTATVLTLGAFILVMLRRDRQRRGPLHDPHASASKV